MDVLLIPGFWLDASSWDPVVPRLESAGHRVHAITLPGAVLGQDRSGVTLRDQVDAVTALVDSLDPAAGVVLVGHSGGGAVAHAVVDARPGRIARVVYLASEPLGDARCINDALPVVDGEVPLPDWSFFDPEMVADLDEALRDAVRARAVPVPVGVARGLQRLSDPRRYDVPATIVCCEYPAAMVREWIRQGHPGAAELARIRDLTFVDLPAGHWPQLTRPEAVADVLLAAVSARLGGGGGVGTGPDPRNPGSPGEPGN